MDPVNPYEPPKADLTGPREGAEYGRIRPFTASGRLGRARFVAFQVALLTVAFGVPAIVFAVVGDEARTAASLLTKLPIVSLPFLVMIGVQRLHDLEYSGWVYLVLLIPVWGLVLGVHMLAGSGTKGANRYGPPPPPNSLAVLLTAWVSVGLVVASIITAFLGPATQAGGG